MWATYKWTTLKRLENLGGGPQNFGKLLYFWTWKKSIKMFFKNLYHRFSKYHQPANTTQNLYKRQLICEGEEEKTWTTLPSTLGTSSFSLSWHLKCHGAQVSWVLFIETHKQLCMYKTSLLSLSSLRWCYVSTLPLCTDKYHEAHR